ncbi:sugar transferase [Streptomyces sp. MUM 203J]|nr:sugar transferase [Streptomyces sp. MUM 203J]
MRAADGGGRSGSGSGRLAKPRWYLPVLFTADAGVTALSVLLVFGEVGQPHPVRYAAVAAALWIGVQAVRHRYRKAEVGESRGALPVLNDWLILIAVLAVLSVATTQTPAPYPSLLALTPTLVCSLVLRRAVHKHLTNRRRAAEAVDRVLVVGEPGALDSAVRRLASNTDHPMALVGSVVVGNGPEDEAATAAHREVTAASAGRGDRLDLGPEVAYQKAADAGGPENWEAYVGLSAGQRLVAFARWYRADVVLLAPGARLTGDRLRELTWALHDAGFEVALAPGLVETSVKRLAASSVAGLTVLRVDKPRTGGVHGALKGAMDRLGAGFGLLLLSPFFLLMALLIRLDSRGPALYKQQRIGLDQDPFTMWKFRTMVVNADQLKAQLAAQNENDGQMFKMRRDPRVTRVGRFLRRTSLDELPQLFNVVRGDMSLVGPRPPLPEEVAGYDATELRRLRVKPGMTGLWQVSGRSDLTWDETVQLDLHYVDNWSFSSDLDVMGRTFRAVVDGRGAY